MTHALKIILLILVIGSCHAESSSNLELVGIRKIALGPNDLLWSFKLHSRESRILQICNVPEGWKLSAENYGESALYKEGGGDVQGDADFGHDALTTRTVGVLGQLILVDRSSIHKQRADIMDEVTIVGLNTSRILALQAENFVRKTARGCPVFQ